MSNKYVSSIFRKIFSPKPQILIANAMRTICKSARRKNTFFRPVLLQIARAVNSADLGQQSKKYGNSRICLIFSRFLSVAQKAEPFQKLRFLSLHITIFKIFMALLLPFPASRYPLHTPQSYGRRKIYRSRQH